MWPKLLFGIGKQDGTDTGESIFSGNPGLKQYDSDQIQERNNDRTPVLGQLKMRVFIIVQILK